MIIEVLHYANFPSDYIVMAESAAEKNIFSEPQWFNNFLETIPLEGDKIIWVGCKAEGGTPLLLWPLWQHQSVAKQPRVITSLANYYTTLWQPIHVNISKEVLKQAIQESVRTICKLNWDYLDLSPLNPKETDYSLIKDAFRAHKKHVQPYFQYGNWLLETSELSFQSYYTQRPGRLKNTLKRKSNKLKKNHTVDYKICTKEDSGLLALGAFNRLYKLGWKPQEPYQDFLPGLVSLAARKGWLRFGLILIDGEVAAAQIWLTANKTAHIYKLCHDPKFEPYSAGSLLTAHLIEYAIESDKVDKVDFLCGDEPYKDDWMNHREERWGFQVSNPKSLRGLIRATKNELLGFYKRKNKTRKIPDSSEN